MVAGIFHFLKNSYYETFNIIYGIIEIACSGFSVRTVCLNLMDCSVSLSASPLSV